jgi:hypothetical protein
MAVACLTKGALERADIDWLGEMNVKARVTASLDIALHPVATQCDATAHGAKAPEVSHQVMTTSIGQAEV